MRAIVEVKWGPMRGHKVTLLPGSTLTVGRTERCNLVLEHDRDMSASHFVISWDGADCRVRDAGSIRGTLVNGAPAAEASIANGGWIRAGNTVFMVYLEAATPPRRGADTTMSPEKQRALACLRDEQPTLYALLDAAKGPRILELVRESVADCRSLFDGVRGEALSEVAPYLVRLLPESGLLERLIAEGWGKRWGVYLTSQAELVQLRRHLRRFLMVHDEETQRRVYFRYYDPPVLDALLGCATVRQRGQLFAMITSFWFERPGAEPVRVDLSGERQVT